MRFLFLSYNYLEPLKSMAGWLGLQPGIQALFACSRFNQDPAPEHVQRVLLKRYKSQASQPEAYLEIWEDMVKTGKNAASSLDIVRETGFIPDIVLNYSANGISLGARQVFPHAYLINFLEDAPLQEARRQLQFLQIICSNLNFSFSRKAIFALPGELKSRIGLLPRMTDTSFFSPDKADPSSMFDCEYFLLFSGDDLDLLLNVCKILENFYPGSKLVILAENSFILKRLENAETGIANGNIITIPTRDTLRNFLVHAKGSVFLNSGRQLLEAMSCGCPCVTPANLKKAAGLNAVLKLEKLLAQKSHKIFEQALEECAAQCRLEIQEKFDLYRIMPAFYAKILTAYDNWEKGKSS